jgi:diacylglycerol kinase family enzyme
MRALLVVNPKATATNPQLRDILARALSSEVKLDVAETTTRGHATELAREAVADDLDLVVVLGGDGTVNEAVNGVACSGTALAVVPGGSANVFARALGMTPSAIEATSEILEAVRSDRRRTINLGRVNRRYFTFCAGVGIDAEVVHAVEGHRKAGKPATPGLYVRTALRHFFTELERKDPALTIDVGEERIEPVFNVVAANASPWTYFGDRPVNPCPQADFESALELLALKRMRTAGTLRLVRQMFSKRANIHGRHLVQRHAVDAFRVTASRPTALQVDGDYLGLTVIA